jgi:glycosyltransferase involved in cell wall biosynthesis
VHVCFFNRSYWPDQAATGQLLTELAEDLVSSYGCVTTVVAGRALNAATPATASSWWPVARESHNGVGILRANGTRFRPRKFAGRASNYLTYFGSSVLASARVKTPDVVVSLTDPPIVGLAAWWTARRTGARFVFLCEDIFPEVASLLEDFHNPLVNRSLDRINRFLLREADAVVALGERMRSRLVDEKGADPDRVRVIHNWADCDEIKPGRKDNPFAKAMGFADRFVVMHSGNVGMSQNLDVLVAAADLLRSKPHLTIAIVGDGARRAWLEAEAARRQLSNLRFLPYQPKETLHDSFAAADVFLVSLKPGIEGYIVPSKLYGILAAGRPFIAAVDPSCEAAEIAVTHRCGMLARPGDAADLADKIALLHDAPAQTRQMGANARDAALRFDRKNAVGQYYELFAQLVRVARAA